jgi:monoamine oxidase
MSAVTRRQFLAAAGSAAAGPVLAHAATNPDFDVIIIGAGAAGISAARRIAQSGKTFAVLEASDHWGGRCFTDLKTFGVPYDQGAHWVHETEAFPVDQLASKAGLETYKEPSTQRLRIAMLPDPRLRVPTRKARVSELEEFYSKLVSCDHAIASAGPSDISCADALPNDIGDWRPTMEFMLGAFRSGSDLSAMSANEYALWVKPENTVRVRKGVGTLMGRLALGAPIRFFSPVNRIEWGSRLVQVETHGERMTARAVIVTASTAVLASGKIEFRPSLPVQFAQAIAKLTLGSLDQVAIEFNGNPLGVQSDELIFEKAVGRQTAALHANFLGSKLCLVQVGGKLCADLALQGEAALNDFAINWLVSQFGSDLRKSIERTHATRWNKQPWTLGAFSTAVPGAQSARKALSKPLGDQVWFAGEAVHESLWGTVAGAWEIGEHAANEVISRIRN